MAEDENFFLKTLNFFSPANLVDSIVGAATGKSEDLEGIEDPSFNQRLGSVVQNSQALQGIGTGVEAATNAPVVGAPLKFVLDFGNRTTDSLFNAAQYYDYKAANDDESFSNFVEGWRKGWDSFGTEGHLTAGQLIGAELTSAFDPTTGPDNRTLNPFDRQGIQEIDQLAKKNWYSDIAGGVSDLAAGFVSIGGPAQAAAKGFRAGTKLDDLAKVELAEETFNRAAKAGELGDLKVGRGKSFVRGMLDAPVSGETYAARLRDSARDVWEHADDMQSAMDYIGPVMSRSSEQAKRIMAETAVYARSLPEDVGTHVIGNQWLALLGSSKAADEVIAHAPLVMDKIANATGAPLDLKIIGEAQAKMLAAHKAGEEVRLSSIMEEVFDTPQKRSTAAALRESYERAADEAVRLKDIRARVMASRPRLKAIGLGGQKVDHLDVELLKESRVNAKTQVASITDELKSTKQRLQTLKREHGGINTQAKLSRRRTDRGDLPDSSEADWTAREAGSARQRVTDTEARIKELEIQLADAKSDLGLLESTPLHDMDEFAKFRDSLEAVKGSQKKANRKADILGAQARTAERQLRDDVKRMREINPTLNATNLWLQDVMAVRGGVETSVANITPSLLDRSRAGMREWIGQSYIYDAGDYTNKTIFHRMGTATVANIGTAYGRRAVNTHDLFKGQQELAMYLKKSKEFTPDEIRAYVNEYLSVDPKNIASVVERAGDELTSRMLRSAGIPDEQISEAIKMMRQTSHHVRSYLTGRLNKTDGEWVKTNEFFGDDFVAADHMIDSAFLRQHLADTVAFPDPSDVKRFIHMTQRKMTPAYAGDLAAGAIDGANYWWKVFNLVRPGLFFRNMFDTGIRAQMLIGTLPYLAAAMAGSRNKMRNTGIKVGDWTKHATEGTALERIGLRMGPETTAKQFLGDSGVKIDVGNGETRTLNFFEMTDGHANAASVAAMRGLSTRGASMGEGIMGTAQPIQNRLIKDAQKWDKYKATDLRWPSAYRDHAQQLLASPTARKMIEEHLLPGDVPVDGAERMRRLFSDPAVRDEYNRLAANLDMPREAFVEQLDWEMGNMFPEPGMAEAVLSGKLQGRGADKWVEEHFPKELRFDLPGMNSVLPVGRSPRDGFVDWTQKMLDGFFKHVVDDPDYWLVRHPVMVKSYAAQVKKEASALLAARQAKFGDDFQLSAKDIATIDRRSKTHAIQVAREYMYDGTYNTRFSQVVHRVAPFFNPWRDSMQAYSKLIYDNPNRIGTLAGLWNAPTNLNQWVASMTGEPLVVDINGEIVRPGMDPEQGNGEKFLVLNSLLGGKKIFGTDLKLRQSTFNTILMGETPWLPGWGPVATVPLAKAINTDQDFALWLSTTDDPILGTMMKSLWPEGQVPQSDAGSLFQSALPATWRKAVDLFTGGRTYWSNVQYGLNARYVESIQNGTAFDPKAALEEAKKDASSAGLLSVISQGVFGLSAKSDVRGQFYVDEMRQIMAIPPETLRQMGYSSPQALFAERHPDAASLTWTFSRNETGINATVVAQSEATRLRPMIDDTPDMGWFIVGGDNVGGEFSQTAYNQQKQFTYGITEEGRKVLDSGEVMGNTMEGIGWDQYLKYANQIEQMGVQFGYSAQTVSAVKGIVAARLGAVNPVWFEAYNTRQNKLADFFNKADLIAKDPKMADRQDMGMYREYRAARQQLLDMYGLKTLGGSGGKSQVIKSILFRIGNEMAAQNIGFQQMWERMLSNEVEPEEAPSGSVGAEPAVA